MEENKQNGTNGCACGPNCKCDKKHKMLKKIFLLIVMVVVFCLGVQLGEIKSAIRGHGFGGEMMRSYGDDNRGGQFAPMMGTNRTGGQFAAPQTGGAPAQTMPNVPVQQ